MVFCQLQLSANITRVAFVPGLCLHAARAGEATLALHCADVAVEAGTMVMLDLDDECLSFWL